MPDTIISPVTMHQIRNAFIWKTRYSQQEWKYLCGIRQDYRRLTRVLPTEHIPFRNWIARRRESLLEELLVLQNSGKPFSDLSFQVNALEKYLINTSRRACRPMSAMLFRGYFRSLVIQQLGVLTPEPSVVNCFMKLDLMDTFWHEDVEFFIYIPSEVMKERDGMRQGGHKAVITPFFVFRRIGNGLGFVAERFLNAKAHELVMEKLCK